MRNLFSGEVYRLFHKRNMYIFLGCVLLSYIAITFMRSSGFQAESVMNDAGLIFRYMGALLGGYFFTSIFSDDLTSKNLITLVGYGTSRTKIVLTKLLLMIVFTTGAFALLTAIHFAMYALLGFAASGQMIGFTLAVVFQNLLLAIGFAVIASVVVYATQKPTFAAVAYFMLAFKVVTMLIGAVSSMLDISLAGRLISGTTSNIAMGLVMPEMGIVAPVIEYLAYLIIALAAAIFLFKRREMEF